LSIIKEKTDLDFSASEFGFFEMLARRKRSVSDCVPDHIEMSKFETKVSFNTNRKNVKNIFEKTKLINS